MHRSVNAPLCKWVVVLSLHDKQRRYGGHDNVGKGDEQRHGGGCEDGARRERVAVARAEQVSRPKCDVGGEVLDCDDSTPNDHLKKEWCEELRVSPILVGLGLTREEQIARP